MRRATSVEVEDWLKTLKHLCSGKPVQDSHQMSTIFRHPIRWGWIGQHENPIALVRVAERRVRSDAGDSKHLSGGERDQDRDRHNRRCDHPPRAIFDQECDWKRDLEMRSPKKGN